MQVKNLIVMGIGTLGALCLALAASAQTTFTWDGTTSSDWDEPSNWDQNSSYPQSGDKAIIPDVTSITPPVLNLNVTIAELEMQDGATLHTDKFAITVTASGGLAIQEGAEFAIDAESSNPFAAGMLVLNGGGAHLVDGGLNLDADGATLLIENSATFDFDSTRGFVLGLNDSAQVQIADGATLTNKINFHGQMMVAPDGSEGAGSPIFRNEFSVNANVEDGTMLFDEGVMLEDTGDALWAAIGDGASLEFQQPTGTWDLFDYTGTVLKGDFVASLDGELRFELGSGTSSDWNAVYTEGSLTAILGGFVNVVDCNSTFFYDDGLGEVSGGSCP